MTCASMDSRPARSRRPSSRSTSARASLGSSSLFSFSRSSLDFLRGIVVAQFLLDGLHLLAQEHLALALAQLLLDLRLDLLLHLDHADLLLHVHEHAAQPLLDAQDLEQPLLLGGGKLDVASHEVGEPARIGDRVEHLMHDLFGKSASFAEFTGAFPDLFVQCDECRIFFVRPASSPPRPRRRRSDSPRWNCTGAPWRAARLGAAVARRPIHAGSGRCEPSRPSRTECSGAGSSVLSRWATANTSRSAFEAASIARSVPGRPAAIGAVSPGKITVPRSGRTGRVWR